jgi:acetate kinase
MVRTSLAEVGANARHGGDTRGRISLDRPVVAMVVPTDEELMIARDTARLAAVGAGVR